MATELLSTGLHMCCLGISEHLCSHLIQNSPAVKKGAAPKGYCEKDVKYKVAAKKWL